jgi:hypothetical protein
MKMEGLPVEVVALTMGDVQSGSNTTPLSWNITRFFHENSHTARGRGRSAGLSQLAANGAPKERTGMKYEELNHGASMWNREITRRHCDIEVKRSLTYP